MVLAIAAVNAIAAPNISRLTVIVISSSFD
jgi:hypothetical protein